jgi:hypothetical protein
MFLVETKDDSLLLLGLKIDFWVFPKWWTSPLSSIYAWEALLPNEVLGGGWFVLLS